MIRSIIQIEKETCNGCGLCAEFCPKSALDMMEGKARLARENCCDGSGDCLTACPTDAISLVEREAPAYDEDAVEKAKEEKAAGGRSSHLLNLKAAGLSPSPQMLKLMAEAGMPFGGSGKGLEKRKVPDAGTSTTDDESRFEQEQLSGGVCRLTQWPVKMQMMPPMAPFYNGADLLVAADCSAYTCANIHEKFMKDKVTMIGCPKLDQVDYMKKLLLIVMSNMVRSVTVLRMDVPCCEGLAEAAQEAVRISAKGIPCRIVTIGRKGQILSEE